MRGGVSRPTNGRMVASAGSIAGSTIHAAGLRARAQGTQIHVAAWPGREPAAAPASPKRCGHVSCCFPAPSHRKPLLCHRGGGVRLHSRYAQRYRELSHSSTPATAPSSIARRDHRRPGAGRTILIAEGSQEAVLAAKAVSDIGGHYSRPGSFSFESSTAIRTRGWPSAGSLRVGHPDRVRCHRQPLTGPLISVDANNLSRSNAFWFDDSSPAA